jgi:hypothetical protein
VSDIFHEVDEEVRQERLQKWWKKYGDYVIAGVSVVAISVAGWKLYQHWEQQQRLKASSQFQSAMQMAQIGQSDLAAQAFGQIAKKAPGGYAIIAQLAEADQLLASGRANDAVALYMKLSKDNTAGLGDVARMRAAWAQADKLSTAELRTLVAPLNDGKSQWRFLAQELIAYRIYKDGQTAEALKQFKALAAAASGAPATVRQRAQAMAILIDTSGGTDYGKVPPPPKAEQEPQQGTATP